MKTNIKPNLSFLSAPDKPLTDTTQDFIPIADIAEDLVLFKNGSAALVMESTSLNFALLSVREQNAIIAGYAALLNSLAFPVQIVVRSQKKDISSYIRTLNQVEKGLKSPKMLNLMHSYKQFIVESIKKKNVLSKRFYIVLPFSQYELGVAKSFLRSTSPKKKSGPLPYPKSYVIKKARIKLYPKRDHLARQASRIGVQVRQLKTPELVSLFYDIYNSIPPTKEKSIFGGKEQ